MQCFAIIWNSINEYLEDVKKDVDKYGEIEDIRTLNLENNEKYEKFVRTIYAQDDIAKWKVDKKVETMLNNTKERKVTLLLMDIEEGNKYYHDKKKRMVYENLETMKKEIREKYSSKIPIYFFDNVFHASDNEKECFDDLHAIKGYLARRIIQSDNSQEQEEER